MNIGRRRRARVARSTMPSPMMGSVLAVHDTTMSKRSSASGSSASRIVSALKRCASFSPRSSVRLAITIERGCWAAKCVAVSSIISPAPTNRMLVSRRSSKMRRARRTAAAAIDTEWAPISVVVRTSLATANERWNSWCRCMPSAPVSWATRTASFIWPRICGSPITMESSPAATLNACRTACPSGSTYMCELSCPSARPWRLESHSVSKGGACTGSRVAQ